MKKKKEKKKTKENNSRNKIINRICIEIIEFLFEIQLLDSELN